MADYDMTDKLDDTEIAILEALLTSSTRTEAAERAGVSERTVYRALTDPDFQEAYRAAKRAAVSHAATRAQSTLDAAMDRLDELLSADKGIPADTRLKAIKIALDFGMKAAEYEGLDADDKLERNRRKQAA